MHNHMIVSDGEMGASAGAVEYALLHNIQYAGFYPSDADTRLYVGLRPIPEFHTYNNVLYSHVIIIIVRTYVDVCAGYFEDVFHYAHMVCRPYCVLSIRDMTTEQMVKQVQHFLAPHRNFLRIFVSGTSELSFPGMTRYVRDLLAHIMSRLT